MTEKLLKIIAKSQLDSDFYSKLEKAEEGLERELEAICFTDDLKRAVMSGGKRLRPHLAFTAYSLGEARLPIVPLMTMIELMHSASLIHDDIVDRASIRRGVPTINASSGSYKAAQSADYLLSRAMEYLHVYKGTGIDEKLAEVSTKMCLGEFMEMRSAYRIEDASEEQYMELIRNKTAFFIGACAACGAIAGGLDGDSVNSLEQYGMNLGTAFQIRDDILDYDGDSAFGKKIGQDLDSGLYTLPLIIAIRNKPELLSSLNDREYVIKTVCSNGIKDCRSLVEKYSNLAVSSLTDIPDSPAKDALVLMAEGLKNRNR